MEELIGELKTSGYGIYLLSNASIRVHDYFPRIPASRYFDGCIFSADYKLLKPQPEIYETLLRRYELKAEECFFVDDLAINVEGARLVGMNGTIFRGDVDLLRRDLQNSGITIKGR
jgi:putative hydrolase of the HAD superfamily